MTRNLNEIDKVYNRLHQVINVDERINYCLSVIQKTKDTVTQKRKHLTESIVIKSSELINAAEIEIMRLYQNKNKGNFTK